MIAWVCGILVGFTALTALAIPFAARNLRGALALAACWLGVVVLVVLGAGVLTGYPRQANSLNTLAYPFESSQVEVIAFEAVPEVAIYIWARNDNKVPLNLALQWNDSMAAGLYKAEQDSKQSGGTVMLDLNGATDREEDQGHGEHNDQDAGGAGGGAGGGGGTSNDYGTSSGASVYVGQRDFPLKD